MCGHSELVLQASATTLCEDHFPAVSFQQGLNTSGDCAVSRLSQLILDDPPPPLDSTEPHTHKSVITPYHLQQKVEAHNKYIQFLVDIGLFNRLTYVSRDDEVIPTIKLLCEHGELLQAAITLRKLHNR